MLAQRFDVIGRDAAAAHQGKADRAIGDGAFGHKPADKGRGFYGCA
jgi:hypothetical protein